MTYAKYCAMKSKPGQEDPSRAQFEQELQYRIACAEGSLQTAPQAPPHWTMLYPEWLESYRQWWIKRLVGTGMQPLTERISELEREIESLRRENAALTSQVNDLLGNAVKNAENERENAELRKALGMIYHKWENGDSCYENPEDFEGYVGNTFQLSYEEENEILGLLLPNTTMQSAGEQK